MDEQTRKALELAREAMFNFTADYNEGEMGSLKHYARDMFNALAAIDAALSAPAAPVAPASECDSPELCRVARQCAGKYGTKAECAAPAAPVGLTRDHVMSALALVPTDMGHPDKCQWIASYLNGIG